MVPGSNFGPKTNYTLQYFQLFYSVAPALLSFTFPRRSAYLALRNPSYWRGR